MVSAAKKSGSEDKKSWSAYFTDSEFAKGCRAKDDKIKEFGKETKRKERVKKKKVDSFENFYIIVDNEISNN